MGLSDILNLFTGKDAAYEENMRLAVASHDMMLLAAHEQNDLTYIAGTSSELYNSHDFTDLGVWSDNDDEDG